jgi:hypothetical protein
VALFATSELSHFFFHFCYFYKIYGNKYYLRSLKNPIVVNSEGSTNGTEVFPDGMGRSGPNLERFAVEKKKKGEFFYKW